MVLPDWGFTLFGRRHTLNPGPFNRKEHMLITILASCAASPPYTNSLIIIQYLPQFYNQEFASSFGYQIILGLAMTLSGYGLAGVVREFLVYPSFCVWPSTLVTIALNNSFHSQQENKAVPGPFGRVYRWSRMKIFLVVFIATFW